jgi:N-acyl-D-aspartate/D-glutamate deacylase
MTTHARALGADRGASVEEAVRRLTSEPARVFGLRGRGVLAPGAFADLNVIDLAALAPEVPGSCTISRPARVADPARAAAPRRS